MTGILLTQALEILHQNCRKIDETEYVSIEEAVGRVLAEDVHALIDQPPFPRSPLDGYALSAGDTEGASKETPVSLQVIDEVFAGGFSERRIVPGTAIRIMTGAPIPDGADCILKQEDTDYGMDTVKIYTSLKPWQNYCFAGDDYKKGMTVIRAGARIGAAEIGVLVGMGSTSVKVFRRPRVLIMSTGSELREPGEPLGPGQIYDSNLHMIIAQMRIWDMDISAYSIVHDEPDDAAAFIREHAGQSDLIVTTGGVSVGKKDIMHDVMKILDAHQLFWKVCLKPGSPTIFGLYEGKPLIALSGNPYGAAANLHLLVRPVLAEMAGRPDLMPRKVRAVYDSGFLKSSKVTRYVRGVYDNGHVKTTGSNESGVLSTMVGCNCMVIIPAGSTGVEPGEEMDVLLL